LYWRYALRPWHPACLTSLVLTAVGHARKYVKEKTVVFPPNATRPCFADPNHAANFPHSSRLGDRQPVFPHAGPAGDRPFPDPTSPSIQDPPSPPAPPAGGFFFSGIKSQVSAIVDAKATGGVKLNFDF